VRSGPLQDAGLPGRDATGGFPEVAPEHGAGAVKQDSVFGIQESGGCRKSKFETGKSKFAVRNVTPTNAGDYGVVDSHNSAGSGQVFAGMTHCAALRFSNFDLPVSIFELRFCLLSSDF
jgi:hypothetical protein